MVEVKEAEAKAKADAVAARAEVAAVKAAAEVELAALKAAMEVEAAAAKQRRRRRQRLWRVCAGACRGTCICKQQVILMEERLENTRGLMMIWWSRWRGVLRHHNRHSKGWSSSCKRRSRVRALLAALLLQVRLVLLARRGGTIPRRGQMRLGYPCGSMRAQGRLCPHHHAAALLMVCIRYRWRRRNWHGVALNRLKRLQYYLRL